MQHIIGHFCGNSFQKINCSDTDQVYKKHKMIQNTNLTNSN